MSRLRKLALNGGLFLGALVVVALLLEIGLGIAKINMKSNLRFIPGKGVTYVPGAYYRNTKEGYSEGYFNSQGFRDYERILVKPAGTYRIAVFGDSYVEALQVNLENTFCTRLERLLNDSASGPRYEVLAFGQSGFGTTQALMRYRNFGVKYSPDMVILAFLTGNDFRNNHRYLNRNAMGYYHEIDEEDRLVLDSSLVDAYAASLTMPKRLYQAAKRHSYLLNLISVRWDLLRQQIRVERAASQGKYSDSGIGELSDLNVYLPDPGDRWEEAIEITKQVLIRFRDEVESRGTRFVLVSLSNAPQVHPELHSHMEQEYMREFDYGRPDRFLERWAAEEAITYLKLYPALLDYHQKTGAYVHGFGDRITGHWNETGHDVAAELILEFLEAQDLPGFSED